MYIYIVLNIYFKPLRWYREQFVGVINNVQSLMMCAISVGVAPFAYLSPPPTNDLKTPQSTIVNCFPQIFTLFPYPSSHPFEPTIKKRGTASMTTKQDKIKYRLEWRQMYSKNASKSPFLQLRTVSKVLTQCRAQIE